VKAYEADTVSAFGSIIAVNRTMDWETAAEVSKLFVEAIIAPGFDPDAIEVLSGKKNLRAIKVNPDEQKEDSTLEFKRVSGGILVQSKDDALMGKEPKVVTNRKPTDKERIDLEFAWRVSKHVKSNAIVLAEGGRTVGVGAGQMSRVDSVKLSI